MEIVKYLEEAAIDSLKADAALKAISEKIKERVKYLIDSKHILDTFTRNDMQYRFYGSVLQITDFRVKELVEPKIRVELIYFCTSKLPKIKREKIENAKISLRENGKIYMSDNSIKPMWYEFASHIDIRKILYEYDDLNINCRP